MVVLIQMRLMELLTQAAAVAVALMQVRLAQLVVLAL
jgi:hypothetical protein